MSRALVLFSGGLDSILAARVLMEQGLDVTAVAFKSLFFDTEKAKKGAAMLGIELIEIDFSTEHLEMVKNPSNGYGKNMNPCIDCHAMMFCWAGELMGINPPNPLCQGGTYDFLATGEVLGQRPMSQNRKALDRVARISGFGDSLLRPLSAKLLPPTRPEREGLVDRDRLLDISGRGRERQMELARQFGIIEYPSAGGGCLLTDVEFGKKLKQMIDLVPECSADDVALLKKGRVYWLGGESLVLVVVGRDKDGNESLEESARNGDLIFEIEAELGPLALVRFFGKKISNIREKVQVRSPHDIKKVDLEKNDEGGIINTIAELVCYHAPKTRGRELVVKIKEV